MREIRVIQTAVMKLPQALLPNRDRNLILSQTFLQKKKARGEDVLKKRRDHTLAVHQSS
jgi:hypothetical protein